MGSHCALELLIPTGPIMELHWLDSLPLLVYFLTLLLLGWWKTKDFQGDEYLLMGRRLTLPGFILSLVSTWYGGILGSSEYSYSVGLSNWIILGLPYYIFAALFAVFLARRAREEFVYSVPDLLAGRFGESARFPASILVLILASPAPYVLTLGVLLHFLLGLPVTVGILFGGLFSFFYVYRDGLAVIVRTDLFQCVLMYGGYALLLLMAWVTFGSPATLWQSLAEEAPLHVSFTGGQPVSYVLVWFFIASWTLVAPMFHQRVYALRNSAKARRGIFLSILAWTVFDGFTTLAGLYAFAHLPELADPRVSHLALAQNLLPVGLYGLFLTGIFATVMSTLDSELFVSGVTLGPDMLGRSRFFNRFSETTLTRIGMAAVIVAAMAMAVLIPSVIDLYYTIGTIAVPGLLLPVLGATGVLPALPPRLVTVHLVAVPAASLAWFLTAKLTASPVFTSIEPFYPGIVVSFLLFLAAFRFRRIQGN